MARRARSIIPSYVYHITHRGNNKQKLFFSEHDFRSYLYFFEETKNKYEMKILAYCVMQNHVHYIAIANKENSFAKTINATHACFAKYFHLKHLTVGHVWQGRYYSCLLDFKHLFAAMRYVERNPVRAKIVQRPWDWVWSSARDHVSNEKGIISLIDYSDYLKIPSWKDYLGKDDEEDDLNEIRKQTMAIKAWGSDDFKMNMEEKYKIKLMPSKVGRPSKEKVVDVPNF